MVKKFLEKIRTNQYISQYLYDFISQNHSECIPKNFQLDDYNKKILDQEYHKYKRYFQTMYCGIDDQIHLDEEQIKSILADEDFLLILAGAGTGKTTTMVSKVKYLVDIKKVNPAKIVVLSYTKKAVEELEKRIVIDLEIPAKVTTFHSLGFQYIREIFQNRKCYVIDENLRNQIFYDYFKECIFPHKEKVREMIEYFEPIHHNKKSLFGKHFISNYEKYKTFDEYFEAYKEMKKQSISNLKEVLKFKIDKMINNENPTTIKNELVKSKGEAIIANFLYYYQIEYQYEKIYTHLMEDRKTYRPDFTLDLLGEEVYVEYFGLSNYEEHQMNRYDKIRKKKEEYHKSHHTKFISLDTKPGENILDTLKKELTKLGFVLKPRPLEEIFDQLLENNKIAQIYLYKNFLYQTIDVIKSSQKRSNYRTEVNHYIASLQKGRQEEAIIQFRYINEFYQYYQKRLYGSKDYGFDFSDLIYYAHLYIDRIHKHELEWEYLIIDEYQDISEQRYQFTKKISDKNHAKIIAVGDDWQSIFAFAGSKIKYIYNFQKYFEGAKLLSITRTYRNSQDLINYSGSFIMKNEDQIKKSLISTKKFKNPIQFVLFEEGAEYVKLKELIQDIHEENPTHKIFVLARKNKMIERCYQEPELKDGIDTKIEFIGYEDLDLEGMTMHKSKGLTSDEVVLIGLDQTFPSIKYDEFWLSYLFKSPLEKEKIPYAEERRLFYVALTRTKNSVYLLVNKNPKLRSPFINEIYQVIQEYQR